jgi:hypothetical protein
MLLKKNIYIVIILLIGALLRFYKLDWGQGLFTHPDEYHIVGSVGQLSFPGQMNPHFFSYGTVTIYLIYFTQELFSHLFSIFNLQLLIPNSFLVGRFYSALFSTLTVLVVYRICNVIFSKKMFSLTAAFLVAITPGLIQQAHFATPESTLIFFIFCSIFFIIKFIIRSRLRFLIFASISLGFAMGVKISSIVLLIPLFSSIIIKFWPRKFSLKKILSLLSHVLLTFATIITTLALVAPYVFLDFPDFRGNLEYEGGLAAGKFVVFYTRQFINTIPVLFQVEKVLPFALGPFILIFSLIGFLFIIINSVKKLKIGLGIIILSFLSIFITNSFLFAKWTRFVAPSFPFFAIFAAFLLEKLYLRNKSISKILTTIFLIGTTLWTIAFFSIYLHSDVRIVASNWIENNFPNNSSMLIEGGNMIDIPLGGTFKRISLDFYSLENDPSTRSKIANNLYSSSYFLIQSRRVFMNHQRLLSQFPKTANFYNALFDGRLGFKEIKEFHSYPTFGIGNFRVEFPDENAEETWSVFDHPVIRIFKKTKQFTMQDYANFLEIQ